LPPPKSANPLLAVLVVIMFIIAGAGLALLLGRR
jgi:flagellin-like protein